MRLCDRRVKIVGTIGPASASAEGLEKAIRSGLNIARLNFSHGAHEDHLQVLTSLRKLSKDLGAPVSILQDLQGPKIRVGQFANGPMELKENTEVELRVTDEKSDGSFIPTSLKEVLSCVKPGQRILLDDGLMELVALEVKGSSIFCRVRYGGMLKDRKGLNLPGANLPIDPITPKDLKDLQFGLSHKVDYVALSFVRQASDMERLRELVSQSQSSHTRLIAKIEMLEALEDLDGIIQASDGVMVARGDLAIEAGQAQLPLIQKRIIERANYYRKPVITATQMLDSMIENPRPTRAEITDVANAVIDGSDALMLSAESASGKHPFLAIQTMHEIISEVERNSDIYYDINLEQEYLEIPEAIAASACLTAMKINAKAIVCFTTTGKTVSLISSYRPKASIIALTHLIEPLNRLELIWGTQTFRIQPYSTSEQAMSQAEELLLKTKMVVPGDRVVVTLGSPVAQGSKTNSIRVYSVSRRNVEEVSEEELPLRTRFSRDRALS
ncbi:MAG: pyruvate kinase [Bdellovibrionaceae bacterium]|nr:pyruvate kinase [Pseudobdellovibrionaceae bacterium]|tara:strand:- start:243 stop:1742 length:1500 start_codon:yes stop_codon:yes gene_type:complete